MNYKVIDKNQYYRKDVYRHFTQDCKCSTSMTAKIDVTALKQISDETNTKFYINFLYILCKVLNSREDYRMGYFWETDELVCYDVINPTQYIFHEDTETCTPVYTTYYEDYRIFYENAEKDIEAAKKTRSYGLDMENHPNWFDASYISWLSYDSLNIELPDGYLFFAPIVNWGRYREENGRLLMPVSVRLNHAIADGYLVARVFQLLEEEIGKGSSWLQEYSKSQS
ncbi:MAG: CatA-like O-acetyltransferase, family 3 [Roseburia sp.]